MIGDEILAFAKHLFPIYRSITGQGLRETLAHIKEHVPELQIKEVPSGTKVFDWTVPQEYQIFDAYLIDPSGRKILDFKKNNLHVVGYSVAVDTQMELKDLQTHLHSLPGSPPRFLI